MKLGKGFFVLNFQPKYLILAAAIVLVAVLLIEGEESILNRGSKVAIVLEILTVMNLCSLININ